MLNILLSSRHFVEMSNTYRDPVQFSSGFLLTVSHTLYYLFYSFQMLIWAIVLKHAPFRNN